MLLDRATEGEELSYMQRIALEHAHLTSRISAEAAKRLVNQLMERFSVSKKGAITLANFMPDVIEEIKVLLGKEAGNFEQETFEAMLDLLNSIEFLSPEERDSQLQAIDEDEETDFIDDDDKDVDESIIPEDLR